MKIDYTITISDEDVALGSGNIRSTGMRIFAVVLKIYVNKFSLDFMPAPVYYIYAYLTRFRYQV